MAEKNAAINSHASSCRAFCPNKTMTIRVLIAEHNQERREQMRAVLTEDDTIEVVGAGRDGADTLRQAHALRPDVVLIAEHLPPADGFAAAAGLASSGLPLETVLVCAENSDSDLRRAMRAGAREVLCRTAGPAEMRAAVQSVYAESLRRRSPAAPSPVQGTIIAVSGAKGGLGKTTLAVNLAAALAADTGKPAVLLDLYTQFGDAALLLNVFPRRTLADLVQTDLADLDAALLEDHLERHACGLKLLAGASAPLPLEALTPAFLEQTLRLLCRDYAYLVLDVPPVLTDTTRRALVLADRVLLVANLFDLTTLADTRLWLEAVALDTVQIVLNRVSPSNKLQLPDVARTLGRTIDFTIPNDGRLVPASVNSGVPFVLSHPASKAACSLFALARSLHGALR